MTSVLDGPPDLLGAQRPAHSHAPSWVNSTGDEAIELAYLAGLDLDEWQQWCLRNALGERPDGKWAAFSVGLVIPRQNGKGSVLEARELAGLFLLHEQFIIHSAHQADTAMVGFNRLAQLIESTPMLSKELARNGIRRANGQQSITLKSGASISFRTRTGGGGRGFSADLLICDEAMYLPDPFLQATLFVLSARHNAQIWYTGSSVDQTIHQDGVALARVRERGHLGTDPSLFYAEWCAAESLLDVTEAVADDPTVWAKANPAFNIRISREAVEHERAELGSNVRAFAVERLGVGDWPDTSPLTNERIISEPEWAACADEESEIDPDAPLVIAFDISPADRSGCIAAAGARRDGSIHVQILEHAPGSQWMVQRLLELQRDEDPIQIVCDGASWAGGSLLPQLAQHEREIRITELGLQDLKRSCALFYDAVTGENKTLRHQNDPLLNAAVAGATKRTAQDGGWMWNRSATSVDPSPLIAVTLAHMQAQSMAPGVGVASFSDWEKRKGPDALAELREKAEQRRNEILGRARARQQ